MPLERKVLRVEHICSLPFFEFVLELLVSVGPFCSSRPYSFEQTFREQFEKLEILLLEMNRECFDPRGPCPTLLWSQSPSPWISKGKVVGNGCPLDAEAEQALKKAERQEIQLH